MATVARQLDGRHSRPRPAFAAAGAVLPVLVVLTWRRLVEIDHTFTVPATELALIGQVHIFEPLSLAAKSAS
jgi:hypothetical protein